MSLNLVYYIWHMCPVVIHRLCLVDKEQPVRNCPMICAHGFHFLWVGLVTTDLTQVVPQHTAVRGTTAYTHVRQCGVIAHSFHNLLRNHIKLWAWVFIHPKNVHLICVSKMAPGSYMALEKTNWNEIYIYIYISGNLLDANYVRPTIVQWCPKTIHTTTINTLKSKCGIFLIHWTLSIDDGTILCVYTIHFKLM